MKNRAKWHDSLMLSLSAAIVAVADHGNSQHGDKKADEDFIRAMQALADDQREFTRHFGIEKCLRVATDPSVKGY